MHTRPSVVRRLAGALLAVALAAGLAACSRQNKDLNPVAPTSSTWTNEIRHIFADRSEGTSPTGCTSCHHPNTGIPDWSTYANVVADSTNIRIRLSNPTDTMAKFLLPGEAAVILAWLAAGAPE